MDATPEQVKAQLRWALACERLNFVIDPPAGVVREGEMTDLATAAEQVQAALAELQSAFASDQG